MSKNKPSITIASYGQYTTWNKKSRDMPKLLKYTDTIEAFEGNEFGIIINVDFCKGKTLDFIIKHPPIKNDDGNLLPQFKGVLYVNRIHTQFFIGDGIWLPIDDKIGEWEIVIYLNDRIVVSKTFNVIESN